MIILGALGTVILRAENGVKLIGSIAHKVIRFDYPKARAEGRIDWLVPPPRGTGFNYP